MTNLVEASFEEKLRVLAALDIKDRLERVIELLARQLDYIKGNVKITSFSTTISPRSINITNLPPEQREALMRRAMGALAPGQIPLGMPGKEGGEGGDDEPNELEELKQKIADAHLTAEAQKVADRELKRLKKMNPAQAEYGVCRTYLETLAEIPWTTMTEDRLGVETLKRARQQLDDDHYGLEKIKKRLLEYLAVLRLKQAVNANLEAEINETEKTMQSSQGSEEDQPPPRNAAPDPSSTRLQLLISRRMVDKSPILLLVGPSGTGKTSLANPSPHRWAENSTASLLAVFATKQRFAVTAGPMSLRCPVSSSPASRR